MLGHEDSLKYIDDRLRLYKELERAALSVIVFIVAVNVFALVVISVKKVIFWCKEYKINKKIKAKLADMKESLKKRRYKVKRENEEQVVRGGEEAVHSLNVIPEASEESESEEEKKIIKVSYQAAEIVYSEISETKQFNAQVPVLMETPKIPL